MSVRAWLELLRAPLLLSPIADVLAGWSLTFSEALTVPVLQGRVDGPRALSLARASLPFALLASMAGCALLAAGMAQNALVDEQDDRARKPNRPLARAALTRGQVWLAWAALSAIGLGAAAAAGALRPALWIGGLTALYHFGLKRLRWPGCAVLGTLRGWDLFLGAVACAAWMKHNGFPPQSAVDGRQFDSVSQARWFAWLYGFYVFGAALHASTDDEPAETRAVWSSRIGLVICCLGVVLVAASPVGGPLLAEPWMTSVAGWATGVLGLWALLRIVLAWRSRPPAAVSGIALSGIYLATALAALHVDIIGVALITAAAIVVLFGVARWMRSALPVT